ncbi:MAG: molybdenum cofactor guanylyltransferase [Alphaproteobacteria bacterium]|nr:molybdenum cofactor guanylyltransferase [Alphaproteobacteria bacterium]
MSTLGVVLAGGSSSRFGADKAAAILGGRTLLQHVCERAAPQVDRLVINRNTNSETPTLSDFVRLEDEWPGEGPLAGVLAALEYARSDGFAQVASFPCDAPFFPADLVSRLRDQLTLAKADYCVARCGEQEHRTFALWDMACTSVLRASFLAGMRSLRDVSDVLTKSVADFLPAGERGIADSFLNINTQDDLAVAARWLASHPAT